MNMPKEFYRTGKVSVDHRTYGGELTEFDFEGHHNMCTMAKRIAEQLRFDNMCKQNSINRDRYKNYNEGE